MDNNLICPVCGKTVFGQSCDYDICPFCGWENDDCFEAGSANGLSLADYKIRYQIYVELNANYTWKNNGFPAITPKDKYQFAHKYSLANEQEVKESQECGCFFCLKTFKSEEINEWISDNEGRTALCPYCGIDSVLPDKSIHFDHDFLEGMYHLWFE